MNDRLLTDEEFVNAQMDYIKKQKRETGVIWHFPLQGGLREDCNRKAQDAKTEEIVRNEWRQKCADIVATRHKVTLREVGEWLEKKVVGFLAGDLSKPIIATEDIEALKRGEMPMGNRED